MDIIAGSIDIIKANAIIILKIILCFLFARNSEIRVPKIVHTHVLNAVAKTKITTINGSACHMLLAASKYAVIALITTVTPFGLIHWKRAAVWKGIGFWFFEISGEEAVPIFHTKYNKKNSAIIFRMEKNCGKL